jgi:hypothetical protein
MKFQALALISELYEPDITVPGANPLKDIEYDGFVKVGKLVNHLVNPVQVAIDSYNLGTSIVDAYGQYEANPTPGNALGFVALAGLGLITLKSGAGGEANEIRALVNDIATQRSEIAKVASTIELSETLNKLFTPARIEELAALQGMTKKELDAMLKTTLPEAKIAAKEVKDAVEASPELKSAFKALPPRDAKGRFTSKTPAASTPLKTAAQIADDNFTKSALATPAAKINWEMPPWNTMADGINTGLSKLPKTELRGTELGQYLKSRPEIDDIAKQNNITADQVRSYLDFAYPPTTAAPAATVAPATAATKLVSKAPASPRFRLTTPAQRAKNTELYKTVTKAETPATVTPATAAATATPLELALLNKFETMDKKITDKLETMDKKMDNKGVIQKGKNAFRWIGSLTANQYNKLDPETKLLVSSFIGSGVAAIIAAPTAVLMTSAIDKRFPTLRQDIKDFMVTPVGQTFKGSINTQIDNKIKEIDAKKQKLIQSLTSAGFQSELIQRVTGPLDEQIKQMQELGIQ